MFWWTPSARKIDRGPADRWEGGGWPTAASESMAESPFPRGRKMLIKTVLRQQKLMEKAKYILFFKLETGMVSNTFGLDELDQTRPRRN
ncbi:hypothetical protein GWI33_023321 [Rhynchophorus ferrugineus]|uniref:Uncharacterized protein n=1 Tax=Rhynchophorus ferrugineus TaxID=354439 RepID=A0A834HN41_RHYFE|nr:hypothetical protein GWI33_023321 [Rhynchophorus ferrugineus]